MNDDDSTPVESAEQHAHPKPPRQPKKISISSRVFARRKRGPVQQVTVEESGAFKVIGSKKMAADRIDAKANNAVAPLREPYYSRVIEVPGFKSKPHEDVRILNYRDTASGKWYSDVTVAGAKVAVEAAKAAGTYAELPERIKNIATAKLDR